MSDVRMALARNIRVARKALGLRQQDLADAIGVGSSETISQIEKGNREVKAWELSVIAKTLKVEFQDLLSEEGPQFGPAPLWRVRATAKKEETEALLRLRSQRYRHVMELTDSCARVELPRLDTFDIIGATYDDVYDLAKTLGQQMELGNRPSERLFRVLEDEYCVMIFYQDLGEDGSAVCVRGLYGPAMLLNGREPPWRRNFSCAHELFHLLTWDVLSGDRIDADREVFETVERKANAFASALLLPREPLAQVVRERCVGNQIEMPQMIRIARDFGVSTSALLWSMVNWGFIPRQAPEEVLSNPSFRRQDRRTMAERWTTPSDLPERMVQLAFIAHLQGKLSRARFATILETNLTGLPALLEEYGLDLEFDLVYKAEITAA